MVLDTGRQVATYLGATFAILLVVIGVGACLLAPVLRRIAPPDRTAAAAATGFAVVVIAPSWWSYLERPMAPLAVAVVVAAVGGLAWWARITWPEVDARRALARTVGRGAGTLVGAAAVSLLQYRRVFTSGWLPSVMTSFTNYNNDLAIYVLQADNIRAKGFGDIGRSADIVIGAWARDDHAGASALSALVSTIGRLPVWQFSMISMTLCIAVAALLLVRLARCVGVERWWLAWAVAVWAICAPFPASVQANFFLGQAVSRTLVLGLVVAVVLFLASRSDADRDWRREVGWLVVVALSTSAGLIAYPAGHVAALAVPGAIAVVVALVAGGAWRQRVSSLAAVGAAVAVGAISVWPRRRIIVDSIDRYSQENYSGFPVQTFDLRVLLGVPGDRTRPLTWPALIACLLVVAAAVAGLVLLVRARRWRALTPVAALVLAPAILYTIVAVRASTSASYQTWKMLGSVQLYAVVGIAALAVVAVERVVGRPAVADDVSGVEPAASPRRSRRWWPLPAHGLAALLLLAWVVGGAQDQWRGPTSTPAIFAGRHIRPEVAGLGGSALVRAQVDLRVALSPYFETMIVASAANLYRIHWAADTYLGPPATGGTCLLTTAGSPPPADAAGPPVPVGAGLVLVPVPYCAPAS